MIQDKLELQDNILSIKTMKTTNQDGLTIKGHVNVKLYGEDGQLKDERDFDNLVTTAGKAHIADQLSSSPAGDAMSHYAIGSGTTDPAAGDTALETELARVSLTSRTDSTNVVTYVGTFPAGTGTGAVTEYGILNASSGGTLLARAEAAVINKAAGDSLVVTHTLTLG
jgi:hypothetical protein